MISIDVWDTYIVSGKTITGNVVSSTGETGKGTLIGEMVVSISPRLTLLSFSTFLCCAFHVKMTDRYKRHAALVSLSFLVTLKVSDSFDMSGAKGLVTLVWDGKARNNMFFI